MLIFGWELLAVSYHPDMFGDQSHHLAMFAAIGLVQMEIKSIYHVTKPRG